MKIDELTIGEAKTLAALFCNKGQTTAHPFIGKYCIVRCYSAGVHAGTVESVDGENVILKDSVRLWKWHAQDGIALSGVAQNGIISSESKIDVVNPLHYLTGVCELIPCSDKARKSLEK